VFRFFDDAAKLIGVGGMSRSFSGLCFF